VKDDLALRRGVLDLARGALLDAERALDGFLAQWPLAGALVDQALSVAHEDQVALADEPAPAPSESPFVSTGEAAPWLPSGRSLGS
jgi:hypothetical protein